ncbi:hypothetical protein MHU86_25981 [Fragilaria crotonensis]|nr:hypothetical protein MHU86_25981 [Fragilaria crotonensis]
MESLVSTTTNESIVVTQEQGVLRDVLDELDRERSRRAELEMEVRKLNEKQQRYREELAASIQKQQGSEVPVSMREYVAMQTERDGFKELVEALTEDNDAVTVAMESRENTLPLHVIRMLEIMPYDPRAVQSAKAEEEVYEWQVYKGSGWTGLIWNFPPSFRKLPIVQPRHGAPVEDARSIQLFPELPPKQTVLTDAAVTKIIKVDRGYSLPQNGGTWEWVSGWRVDKHVGGTDESNPRSRVDCDEDGWSYGEAVEHFITSPAELCWENADVSNNVARRPFRRRRWARQRALRSYPCASNNTLQFLRILAENARLSVTVTKLTDQLVATKNKLTENEDVLVSTKDKHKMEVESLKKELKLRDETINRMPRERSESGEVTTPSKPRGPDLRLDQHIDMVRNVAGGFANSLVSSASNAASSAFRKTPTQDHKALVQDQLTSSPTIGGDDQSKKPLLPLSAPTENTPFDWRRLGLSITPKSKGVVQDLSVGKVSATEDDDDKVIVGGLADEGVDSDKILDEESFVGNQNSKMPPDLSMLEFRGSDDDMGKLTCDSRASKTRT